MRRLSAAPALAAVLALLSCTRADLTGPRQPVLKQALTLYTVTGTPVGFPAAISVSQFGVEGLRADVTQAGEVVFDIAFDFDASGPATPRIRVQPARTFSSVVGGSLQSVSIARTDVAFENASTAPTAGWIADTAQVVRVGEAFFLQTNRCRGITAQQYSKVVVDSIYPAARKMRLRVASDPNCGQRNFPTPDFPPSSP